eukprot:623941-Pyramimonas_sp.AAC.1
MSQAFNDIETKTAHDMGDLINQPGARPMLTDAGASAATAALSAGPPADTPPKAPPPKYQVQQVTAAQQDSEMLMQVSTHMQYHMQVMQPHMSAMAPSGSCPSADPCPIPPQPGGYQVVGFPSVPPMIGGRHHIAKGCKR